MLLRDTLRKLWVTKSRFFAIMAIIAISCGFFAGVKSTCPNMKETADIYYNDRNLMDIKLLSTIGFSEDNIKALSEAESVTQLYAGYSADLFVTGSDGTLSTMRAMSCDFENPERINSPTLVDGRFPQTADECVVGVSAYNPDYFKTGEKLAFITNDESKDIYDYLSLTEFKIVGVVTSPLYISFERGSTSIGNGALNGYVLLPEAAFSYEAYTEVYLKLSDFEDLSAFDDSYDDVADAAVERFEAIGEVQLNNRIGELLDEANDELDDARKELADGQREYDEEWQDYQTEIADARTELDDGWTEYNDGFEEYTDALADYNTVLEMTDEEFARLDNVPLSLIGPIKEEFIETAIEELTDAKAELDDAYTEIEDGRSELEEETAKAEQEFSDAREKLRDGESEYAESYKDYLDKIADAEKQIEDGQKEYDDGVKQYEDGKLKLAALQMMTDSQFAEYSGVDISEVDTARKYAVYLAQSELEPVAAKLEKAKTELISARTELKKQQDEAKKEFADARLELDDGWAEYKEEYTKYRAEISDAKAELDDGIAEYNDGLDEYNEALADLHRWQTISDEVFAAEEELPLEDAVKARSEALSEMADELTDAKAELDDALIELNDGEKELADSIAEAEEEFADARTELADGEREISDAEDDIQELLNDNKWYVFDRSVNPDYSNYGIDAERIDSIAVVFPIFFILVAALVCLTTMTRMVEEQRTEIGTLKALGYSRASIIGQYIGYALIASILGGVIGLSVGFVLFPKVIFAAYSMLYDIPNIITPFRMNYAVGCIAAAVLCTGLASFISCYRELVSLPAQLMRPKPPKNGKRVLLERVTFIWKRMSFTQKVTIRNLSRYKGRVLMTVIGVAGCTALLLTGFCLKYSIGSIIDKQYGDIFIYDALAIVNDSAPKGDYKTACEAITTHRYAENSLAVMQKTISVSGAKKSVDCYIFVPSEPERLDTFISLHERISRKKLSISEDSIIINEKLSKLLSAGVGDTVFVGEERKEVIIGGITENYTMNYVYMSPEQYSELFGKYTDNVFLLNLTENTDSDALSNELLGDENIIEVVYSENSNNKFADVLGSLDSIVLVIILSAASLALVVLYNLTNINVNERTRELATIRVLGFYNLETANFIYRENTISTFLGIVFGLGLGIVLKEFVISTSEVDIVMFSRDMPFYALVFSAALTALFALMVNFAMYRKIKSIDMAASMKAIE